MIQDPTAVYVEKAKAYYEAAQRLNRWWQRPIRSFMQTLAAYYANEISCIVKMTSLRFEPEEKRVVEMILHRSV